MTLDEIRNDIYLEDQYEDGVFKIYFCGDSFYGYYSIGEFEELLQLLNQRLEELKEQMK